MTKIKVCGITNIDDAMRAVKLGADALGFIFADSPRRISPQEAGVIISMLPPFVIKVGVFVNEHASEINNIINSYKLNAVQLHGEHITNDNNSIAAPVIRAFRVKDSSILASIKRSNSNYFLLDTYSNNKMGGTGECFDWSIARKATQLGDVILSGGLNHNNITDALKAVRPYAVDVCSGIESAPGQKDYLKMQQFINEVRSWEYRTS